MTVVLCARRFALPGGRARRRPGPPLLDLGNLQRGDRRLELVGHGGQPLCRSGALPKCRHFRSMATGGGLHGLGVRLALAAELLGVGGHRAGHVLLGAGRFCCARGSLLARPGGLGLGGLDLVLEVRADARDGAVPLALHGGELCAELPNARVCVLAGGLEILPRRGLPNGRLSPFALSTGLKALEGRLVGRREPCHLRRPVRVRRLLGELCLAEERIDARLQAGVLPLEVSEPRRGGSRGSSPRPGEGVRARGRLRCERRCVGHRARTFWQGRWPTGGGLGPALRRKRACGNVEGRVRSDGGDGGLRALPPNGGTILIESEVVARCGAGPLGR